MNETVRRVAGLNWTHFSGSETLRQAYPGLIAVDAAGFASRWCLVTAVAALGVKTSFSALIKAGWRPALLMVFETAWIGGVVLSAVLLWH